MGNSNGIIQEGELIYKDCSRCGCKFCTYKSGTRITFKGPYPEETECKPCHQILTEEILQSLITAFEKKNSTV